MDVEILYRVKLNGASDFQVVNFKWSYRFSIVGINFTKSKFGIGQFDLCGELFCFPHIQVCAQVQRGNGWGGVGLIPVFQT